jgi:hypothetical protein
MEIDVGRVAGSWIPTLLVAFCYGTLRCWHSVSSMFL